MASATSALRRKEEAAWLTEPGSLTQFFRSAWPQIERKSYVHNWHIDAVGDHLEAVYRRQIKRLIINVPFRTSKSSLVSVAYPSWVWAQEPGHQFLCGSHAEKLAVRDNLKMRRLVQSPWFQARWGSKVTLTSDQNQKTRFENSEGGYRIGFGMTSGITGDGGDTVLIDDPHDRDSAQSEAERETALETFDQSIVTRLNEPEHSAIIVIMQRLHEEDLSGHLLSQGGWEHLMLPMEYDPRRHCVTALGFEDPRTEPGELLWPERFPADVVAGLKASLGSYGTSGQLQQQPTPAEDGIFPADSWQTWTEDKYPAFDYIVASLDSAYTEKQINDPSALTIWGVWKDKGRPNVMLIWAWQKWLKFGGEEGTREAGESERAYLARVQKGWGLIEWLTWSCNRFRVNRLLIEAKANGISVAQEIRRRNVKTGESWSVQLINPGSLDKVARANAVQPFWENGMVWAPDKDWANDLVIDEMKKFPMSKHRDLTDSATQAMKHLRDIGLLTFAPEDQAALMDKAMHRSQERPLYEV